MAGRRWKTKSARSTSASRGRWRFKSAPQHSPRRPSRVYEIDRFLDELLEGEIELLRECEPAGEVIPGQRDREAADSRHAGVSAIAPGGCAVRKSAHRLRLLGTFDFCGYTIDVLWPRNYYQGMDEMTAAEALAELKAAGYSKAAIWRAGGPAGLVTIYLNDGTRGQIWCHASCVGSTVRDSNDVWAAIHRNITRK